MDRGEFWVIMGSGPSLCAGDAAYVRGKARVMVINTSFRMAPWADVLYTNDHDWLGIFLRELYGGFNGEIWCGHPQLAGVEGIHHIPFDKTAVGLKPQPGHIAWGMNSGGAGLSLACNHFAACAVVLLGFDQQWTDGQPRWHGAHPEGLQNQKPGFHRWAVWFRQAAADAAAAGIEIINCSRETSLDCFTRKDLRAVL